MTSFDHVMIPTRGNWFQTNPVEHESDDPACNTVCYQWYRLGMKYQQGMETSFKNALQLGLAYSSLTSAFIVSPNIMYMRDFVL